MLGKNVFLKRRLGQKCCGVKSILGGTKKLGVENFWRQIVGGQDFGVKFFGGAEMESGFLCPP